MSNPGYSFNAQVVNPEKIGDGFGAYIRYEVITQTDHQEFKESRYEVNRRFREFHALYESLVDAHREEGFFIPHPPEKSVIMVARVKTANKNLDELDQIERRRYSLERFINRIGRCPHLCKDSLFIDFLTAPVTRVKARDSLLKFRAKLAYPMSLFSLESEELDKWYEEKVEQIFAFDSTLLQLYYTGLDIHTCRKELILSTRKFIAALGELRSTEQSDTVVKAFGAILDLKEQSCAIYEKLALNDLHELIGNPRGTLDDLISLKHTMHLYTKKFNEVRALAERIDKLREQQQRQLGGPNSATEAPKTSAMIEDLEKRHSFAHKSLEEFYDQIKISIDLFHKIRSSDFRESYLRYLCEMKSSQEELLKMWEEVLPICQSIQ